MKTTLSIDSYRIKKDQNKSIDKLLQQQTQSITKKNTIKTTTAFEDKSQKNQLKPYKSLSIDTTLPVQNTFQSMPSQSSNSSWRKISPLRKKTPITLDITSIDQTTHKHSQTIKQNKRISQQLSVCKQNLQNASLQLKQANTQINSLKNKIQSLQSELLSLSLHSKQNTHSLLFDNLKNQFQSQQIKNKILQKELTVQKQINQEYKTNFNNQSLITKIEYYIHEIQQKKMQAKYYQQQYQQLKSNRDKKRKERDQRHRQEMTTLSSEILRMHNQLYSMRMNSKSNINSSNQQIKGIQVLLSRQQMIINIIQKLTKSKQQDNQLIKLLKQKRKQIVQKGNNKQTSMAKNKILCSLNKLRCQGFDIKNNNKIILLLREIQSEIQNYFN